MDIAKRPKQLAATLALAVALVAAPATAHEMTLAECKKRCEVSLTAELIRANVIFEAWQKREQSDLVIAQIGAVTLALDSHASGCMALCDHDAKKAAEKK